MPSARAWTLLMLAGTASLAGCLETEDGALVPEGVDDLDGGALDNATGLPALVPVLGADVLNGTAPLLVNLTLSADGAGGNTTWRIDFGDGNSTEGNSLPATVNHTFGPGNHTVTATLLRGNETATTDLNVTVLAGGPAAGTLLREDVLEEDGLLLTGVQYCGAEEGVDKATHAWDLVDVEEDGTASAVSGVHVLLELHGASNLDLDIAFLAPDGRVLGQGTAFNAVDGPTEEFTVSGPLPAGTYTLEVKSCSGAVQEYTLTATATYVAA